MKFAPSKKILVEDMPEEQRGWIPALIDPINAFFEKASSVLAGGIIIADNSRALVKKVDIVANQTYPLSLNVSELKQRPVSVTIGEVVVVDSTTPTAAFSIHWNYNEGSLSYTLLGLTASKAYTVTLIIAA